MTRTTLKLAYGISPDSLLSGQQVEPPRARPKYTLGQRLHKLLEVVIPRRVLEEVEQVDPADLDWDNDHLAAMLERLEYDIKARQRLLAALRDVQAHRLGGY